jgi:hypothetical protein
LNRLTVWAESRQLSLAPGKCSALYLGHSNCCHQYMLSGCMLDSVDCVKDSGVAISSSLKFSAHCANVAKSGFKMINYVFAAFRTRDIGTLMALYNSFIRPRLEYATVVWSPFHIRDIKLLERVQRLFTRRLPGFKH